MERAYVPSMAGRIAKMKKPRLLIFVSEDWYFWSHRLPIAQAALEAGYDVALLTRVSAHGEQIIEQGIRLIPIEFSRSGKNPLGEWRTLLELVRVFRKEKPDILHCVAIKPVLYGSLAAKLAGIRRIVNAVAGLGHIFTAQNRNPAIKLIVVMAFRFLLKGGCKVITQNPDDSKLLIDLKAVLPNQIVLIRGAGVDLEKFTPSNTPTGTPIVMFAARLLWEKGAREFVEAAKILRGRGVEARFVIVGAPDNENHSAIPQAQLDAWATEPNVECWGKRTEMHRVLSECEVFCLPSYYGEGVPKVLLEAAAAGKALVTTDMPGCREVVIPGVNGLQVEPRNPIALATAIRTLLSDRELCSRMGKESRALAESEFDVERVKKQTIALYAELLNT